MGADRSSEFCAGAFLVLSSVATSSPEVKGGIGQHHRGKIASQENCLFGPPVTPLPTPPALLTGLLPIASPGLSLPWSSDPRSKICRVRTPFTLGRKGQEGRQP